MYCISCGKEIIDGAKFCSFCGTKQITESPKAEKMYCATCRKEFDYEMIFCDECGMKLSAITNIQTTDVQSVDIQTTDSKTTSHHAKSSSEKLMEMGLASIYHGNKSIGEAFFTGTVYLYADRIETKGVLSDKPEIFVKTDEIKEVSKGSYMLIWASLIISLKNGQVFTISGATAGSETIDRAIKIINQGINH